MKYIVVYGGVVSGIGKGVIASSTGALLQRHGIVTTVIKIDPYVNIDAGSISPLDHGEVFVLADGSEVDLDLGNYERFLNITLTNEHSITTGKIYNEVIKRERRGDYLGKTVQIVPHLTNLIQEKLIQVSQTEILTGDHNSGKKVKPDVCIIELGGTIGDIEGYVFVEALRCLKTKLGKGNVMFIAVEYIPCLKTNEQKTKPLQNGIKQMKSLGVNPDFIICRCDNPMDALTTDKIALYCEIEPENIFRVPHFDSVYKVPGFLEESQYCNKILSRLSIVSFKDLSVFDRFDYIFNFEKKGDVTIAIVGKYIKHKDSYISVFNAINFSAKSLGLDLKINWIEAYDIEIDDEKALNKLKEADGILIPGGFGTRGTEGKIKAAQYARENNVPFFGICLGFQIAVIEFCRNVLGLVNATSEEFHEDAEHKVIQKIVKENECPMRSGAIETFFTTESRIKAVHGNQNSILERHRHKYKVNLDYVDAIQENGMCFVATDKTGQIKGIFELKDHKFFVGAQHHPEFNARPANPHKLFTEFVKVSFENKE
ncbi:CTP synthase ura7 [Conglomerata obtusa]